MTFLNKPSPIFEVSVSRSGQDALRLSWKTNNPDLRLSIYYGNSPKTIQHQVSFKPVKGQTAVTLPQVNPNVAHYFKIVPEGSRAIIIGERRLPLKGTVNSRDLGGYETTDGRRVKWGKVFRSDHLARLTDRDIAFLQQMQIRSVCDFRTSTEVRHRPDRFPADRRGAYFHLPVNHLKFDPTILFKKLKQGDSSWLTPEFLIEGYILNVDQFARTWGEVFKRLADPAQLPLLFHCTGGKDRAGTCAALILLALGVPEKTVIYDYGLSNIYIAEVVNQIYAQFDFDDLDRERISPYFSAPQYCLEAMLAHLHKNHGSPIDYLKSKAGVTAEMLQQIRGQLLE